MSGRPWYAFHVKRYERKTAHLSLMQDGAYRRMLDYYYDNETPLPAPLVEIHRIVRCQSIAEKQAVSAILAQFFTLQNDGWHNDTADEELGKAAIVSARRADAGSKGGSKKVANATANEKQNSSKPEAIATTVTLTETDTEKETEEKSKTAALPRAKPKRTPLPDAFPVESSIQFAQKFWTEHRRLDLTHSIREQCDQFRDYHAKEATLAADWPAAWRTWVRNALKFNKKESNGHGPKGDQWRDGIQQFLDANGSEGDAQGHHERGSGNGTCEARRSLPAPSGCEDGVTIPGFLRRAPRPDGG